MKLTHEEVGVVGFDRAGHYAALLDEQEGSGLSVSRFALARGLSPVTLYLWRRKLGRAHRQRKAADTSSAMLAVDVVGRDNDDVAEISSGFEVLLANGHRVRIPNRFDAARLAELMTVLAKC